MGEITKIMTKLLYYQKGLSVLALLDTNSIKKNIWQLAMLIKGIYNRLPLIKCPLLDIDLTIHGLFLLYEVKFYKSWSSCNLMEIYFTEFKDRMKKCLNQAGLEPATDQN